MVAARSKWPYVAFDGDVQLNSGYSSLKVVNREELRSRKPQGRILLLAIDRYGFAHAPLMPQHAQRQEVMKAIAQKSNKQIATWERKGSVECAM